MQMPPLPHPSPPPLMPEKSRAVLWVCLAAGIFALTFALPRLAEAPPALIVIVFMRYVLGLVTLLPFALQARRRGIWVRRASLWGHGMRAGASIMTTACIYWAVQVIPLVDAATIWLTEPAMAAVLATLLLGERVGRIRWLAVVVSFTGAVIVVGPSLSGLSRSLIDPGALVALAGALSMALEGIIIRYLALRESPLVILVWLNATAALICLPLVIWVGMDGGFGNPLAWLPVLAIGPLAALGQYLNIRAYALMEVSFLGPFIYVRLMFTALLGYLFFAEIPGPGTLAGAALIICAGVILLRAK